MIAYTWRVFLFWLKGHLDALHNVDFGSCEWKAGIRAGGGNKLSAVWLSLSGENRWNGTPWHLRETRWHHLLPSIISSSRSFSLSLCLLCFAGRCFAFRGERGNDEPPIEMIKVSHLKWVFCHQQNQIPSTSRRHTHTHLNTNCTFTYTVCTVTRPFTVPAWSHCTFVSLSVRLWTFNPTLFSRAVCCCL